MKKIEGVIVKSWFGVLITRIYYLAIMLIILGGIMWLNDIDYYQIVLTVGGILLVFYYLIQFLYPPQKIEYDWALVYPELAGIQVDENDE